MPVKVGSYGIIGCKGPLVTELAPACYVCKTKHLEIAHLVALTYYLDVSHFFVCMYWLFYPGHLCVKQLLKLCLIVTGCRWVWFWLGFFCWVT
jgi:hypothetical protein